jgi:hypothetical protein
VVGISVLFAISIELPGSGRVWSRRQAVESILRVSNRVFHRHSRDDSFPGPGYRNTISSHVLLLQWKCPRLPFKNVYDLL